MPRLKLTIEYDGGPFVGWQRQTNGRAVQEAIEDAVVKLTGETVTIRGAGRTDAGVHALAQVAHLDLKRDWSGDKLRDALNAHLRPELVAVLRAEIVPADFDARFSAIRRHYLYRILTRRAPPVLTRGRVWHVKRRLDAVAMQRAARRLIGKHDFTTFRSVECQAKSPVKTLDRLDVVLGDDEVAVTAEARSFLHNQVRSLVGSLKLVGEGSWSADDLQAALEARDRAACGPVAPAEGLYLMRVDYPPAGQAKSRPLSMARTAMNRNREVDEWLDKRQHPLDEALRRARDIILKADRRVTESIKWSTPTFSYEGNIASINPSKNLISIMFHRGAEIPGKHPRLEGDGKLVRTMRFASLDEVEAGRADLEVVIRAWCDWKAGS